MRTSLLLVLLILVGGRIAPTASACNRCGHFGSSCRYFKTVAKPIVKVVTPDVFVVQNNYPQPLVGQGNTLYQSNGFQSALLPFLDPNRYFEQEIQLIRAADATNAIRSQRASVLLERVIEIQAPAVERLAAGQAAQMVLQAAGLDPSHNTGGPTQQAVVINRDAAGRLQVLPLNAEQYKRLETTTTRITEEIGVTADAQANAAPVSLVVQHCGRCHNAGGEGHARFALDGEVTSDMRLAAIRSVMAPEGDPLHMPKGATLDGDTVAAIVAELSQ